MSTVSSDDITKYFLLKIKDNKIEEKMDDGRVYMIPHSSKPINGYFNPKLLTGLYPTLFCYGRGVPDDQSRLFEVNLREHVRYLLSYSNRRFERNHSFIFVILNILQRRGACFQAKLIATKPYFQSSAQELLSLNSNDIETALNLSISISIYIYIHVYKDPGQPKRRPLRGRLLQYSIDIRNNFARLRRKNAP